MMWITGWSLERMIEEKGCDDLRAVCVELFPIIYVRMTVVRSDYGTATFGLDNIGLTIRFVLGGNSVKKSRNYKY